MNINAIDSMLKDIEALNAKRPSSNLVKSIRGLRNAKCLLTGVEPNSDINKVENLPLQYHVSCADYEGKFDGHAVVFDKLHKSSLSDAALFRCAKHELLVFKKNVYTVEFHKNERIIHIKFNKFDAYLLYSHSLQLGTTNYAYTDESNIAGSNRRKRDEQ